MFKKEKKNAGIELKENGRIVEELQARGAWETAPMDLGFPTSK